MFDVTCAFERFRIPDLEILAEILVERLFHSVSKMSTLLSLTRYLCQWQYMAFQSASQQPSRDKLVVSIVSRIGIITTGVWPSKAMNPVFQEEVYGL